MLHIQIAWRCSSRAAYEGQYNQSVVAIRNRLRDWQYADAGAVIANKLAR